MNTLKIITHIILIILASIQIGFGAQTEDSPMAETRSARQLSFWPYNNGLSRQIFDMLDIVTDVTMLTLLGIPILGLVALGVSVFNPGLGAAAGSGRKKRSPEDCLMSRTRRAMLYARNLFDVLANLEDTFQKYDISESECQLKAVCEVHQVDDQKRTTHREFGAKIRDLLSLQKDLEENEIIPFAKIIFGQYSDAATYGVEHNDCSMVYSRCQHSLDELLDKKQNVLHEDEAHRTDN